MPKDVTRHISEPVKLMLWGRAAGRCEFAGCNKALWKSSVTQEQVNIAEKAHIYSFGDDGPRGNVGIPEEQVNDITNLILVCQECHKNIDKDKGARRYSVALLQEMKRSHERRIEIVTGIHPDKRSQVLHYGANIGEQGSPLQFGLTAPALFPTRYPSDDKAIDLSTVNSSFSDRDRSFWAVEEHNLASKFSQRVGERLASGEISHLSVFARAPQPLLVLLGTLLTGIPYAEVFQLHKEPQGWGWPEKPLQVPFIVNEPDHTSGTPALVLSLSASITQDRIEAVLGSASSIWTVTIPTPNNDFVKSREQLASFRSVMRPLMDRIKARHGQNATLHIFPAIPVSIAVELGRIRMPKADMPWRIYDQVTARGGFVPAISIPEGGPG